MDLSTRFAAAVSELKSDADSYVPEVVALILSQARQGFASDVHLTPCDDGLRMQWRIDGVLQTIAIFDVDSAPRMIARLKVLCGLLTYRTDVPQEGRVSREFSSSEIRVTTFPTLHGEKAAIRLFAESTDLQLLNQLGLPQEIENNLRRQLQATDGVILLTGPSGSGKTTTVYACLREILALSGDGRSIMTLEDPIEVAVAGTTQSQVRPSVGFDLAAGLKSLMRQDPDVIMVGEIRDPGTAEVVFQAALTGHLVLTTFHAGSAVEAITRLMDMKIEPYLLRSSLRSIVCQRLLRKLDPSDSAPRQLSANAGKVDRMDIQPAGNYESGKSVNNFDTQATHTTAAYRGRMVLAELLDPNHPQIAQAVMNRMDARSLASIVAESGMVTLREAAERAIAQGFTTDQEVFRVLGRNDC